MALAEALQPRMHYSIGTSSVADVWSYERIQAMTQEVVARFHAENRPSIQAEYFASQEFEFQAIPLVPTESLRVKFRDVGPLPPPGYFRDEPVVDD